MFDIEEELKKLPEKPGVYIMHDRTDQVIYVGKAIVLKNRVRQYFQSSRNLSPKILKMVESVARFEYIVTDSELEALVLECNLIKEYSPRYNTLLKDDKAYPYIKITVDEEFPRVMSAMRMEKDKAKYYGPFTSRFAVKETVLLLQKLYGIRNCSANLKEGVMHKSCINYQMGICSAPCIGKINRASYLKSVDSVQKFLEGNHKKTLKELEEKMNKAAKDLEYEEAAKYRDLISGIKHVTQKQRITGTDNEDRDVIAGCIRGEDAIVQIFYVRGGKILGREHFRMSLSMDEDMPQLLEEFIKQYYGGTPYIPPVILLQCEIENMEILSGWLSSLRGHKVSIIVPKKGMKEGLVELAAENARIVLVKDLAKIKDEDKKTIGAVKEIEEILGLDNIKRMEAFDISNISGTDSVGSMVVFEMGKPKKSDYRKFRIRTVKGPDDYASMREVLTRRFEHGLKQQSTGDEYGGFSIFPDIIMMDGGRGQVNIALGVLSELKLKIPVCGMVKDDNHRTRGLYYNNEIMPLDTKSEAFKLITRMQDEAHRFAIEFHRSLRSKREVKSVLDDIKGIGPAKRLSLMKHFKDIDVIRKASVEELMQADMISEANAKAVYEFFH